MTRPGRMKLSQLSTKIKKTALAQISKNGAASLSLRGIARALKITAPAIYNYFPDRDALVTSLIIDAFNSFGNSQLAASDSVNPDDLPGRLHAIGIAYRLWAIKNPQLYQLLFGQSIPGYSVPEDEVKTSGTRSLRALLSVLEDLHSQGRLKTAGLPKELPPLLEKFKSREEFGMQIHPESFTAAVLIWIRVHGLVSLEIGGHLPSPGGFSESFFDYELRSIADQFIKGNG